MLKTSQALPPVDDDEGDHDDVIGPHNVRFLEKPREIPSRFLLTRFLFFLSLQRKLMQICSQWKSNQVFTC